MATPSDLVTLATLKGWLGQPSVGADDGSLGLLISQLSRTIISGINRVSVLPKLFTEVRDGNGGPAMMLKNYPVISMVSLTVDGQAVPVSTSTSSPGYLVERADPEPPGSRQSVLLRGSCFNRGIQNVVHTYNAGYQVSAEPVTAAAAVTVEQPYGVWGSSISVVNASTGAALSKVAGAPGAGQYQLSATIVGGYVFNAADHGATMLISYGFIPADLAQATLEWAAERYAYSKRVGMQSKTLGGLETMSYAITSTPKFITAILQQFTSVSPL
jgi:hypothetical protein